MQTVNRSPLTSDQIAEILARPNGEFALIELAIMGRIDVEAAVTAIEEARPVPLLKRIGYALVRAVFGPAAREHDL